MLWGLAGLPSVERLKPLARARHAGPSEGPAPLAANVTPKDPQPRGPRGQDAAEASGDIQERAVQGPFMPSPFMPDPVASTVKDLPPESEATAQTYEQVFCEPPYLVPDPAPGIFIWGGTALGLACRRTLLQQLLANPLLEGYGAAKAVPWMPHT